MEILDPHIHLWDVHRTARPARPLVRLLGWNRRLLIGAAKLAFPKDLIAFLSEKTNAVENFLPEDYLRMGRPLGIERFIHIQAGWKDDRPLDAVGETEWLEGLRKGGAPLAAIVAYADLRLGDGVAEVLDAHVAASPVMRGVRFMLAWHDHRMVHSFAPAPQEIQRIAYGSVDQDAAWLYEAAPLQIRKLNADGTQLAWIQLGFEPTLSIQLWTGEATSVPADFAPRWVGDLDTSQGAGFTAMGAGWYAILYGDPMRIRLIELESGRAKTWEAPPDWILNLHDEAAAYLSASELGLHVRDLGAGGDDFFVRVDHRTLPWD